MALLLPCCGLTNAGSSDPYEELSRDPCLPGNVRVDDSACVLPRSEIVIDGSASDWYRIDEVELVSDCPADGCLGTAPARMQVARVEGGGPRGLIALRLRSADGAPLQPADDLTRLVLELQGLDEDSPSLHALVLSRETSRYRINETFAAIAWEAVPWNWTPDGLEVAFARDFLPFVGGFRVAAYLARERAGAVVTQPAAPRLYPMCWRADAWTTDPCRGTEP